MSSRAVYRSVPQSVVLAVAPLASQFRVDVPSAERVNVTHLNAGGNVQELIGEILHVLGRQPS